jgi:alpha-D-ribose 1-methylphosphonate 5-triphosphate synthase subunit PhnH
MVPMSTPFETACRATFRTLLACLARPGTLGQLTAPPLAAPAPGWWTGIAFALLDQTQGVALAHAGRWRSADDPLVRWLTLRCHARHVPAPQAQLALLADPACAPLLDELPQGSLTYPEAGATAVVLVGTLACPAADATVWQLRGPGIAAHCDLALDAAAGAWLAPIQRSRAHYPRGIDVVLVDQAGRCAGLPRTTRITERGL